MEIAKLGLEGLFEITPESHDDFRGYLVRVWDDRLFRETGLNAKWVQESHSHTEKRNTIRGFHIQFPPYTEAKLIRAIRGEVKWVVVDLRKNSSTFGQWTSKVLTDKLKNVLYVEKGFANGSITLSDDADLIIKADNYFSQDLGTGINWKDPDLRIDWGLLKGEKPIVLERDDHYPSFKEFKQKYGGI